MSIHHQVLLAAVFSALTYDATHGEEIINGKKVQKNSLQYMASVQNKGVHICGGFLIDPSYVLTAAHCDFGNNMSVILGTQNIAGNNLKRYMVKTKYKHQSYRSSRTGNDIMLLKLSKKVKQNKFVKTIKIQSKDKPVKPNAKCLVAGWGKTENQKRVDDLLMTYVPVINFNECQKEWNKVNVKLPDNVLCAGGYKTKSGACQGDSGGPLVCSDVAVGIVSFNYNGDCAYPNVPNIYTQISKFSTWIKDTIKKGV
ncbi:granzyme-like protein 1 [Hoplias malabaricus]|uniref:granzyme-like protein 1 n=1 Tax=Hoplias malabaricus TaxID=27720 RepID=UPI0034627029